MTNIVVFVPFLSIYTSYLPLPYPFVRLYHSENPPSQPAMSELIDQQTPDLPNEILLHAFRFFPLKALIIGRTVSQDWRRLIPLADISPIRRALLDFYLTLVSSPIFPQTRPWVLANLQPFDRQAYIDDLMRQHPYVPEAFRVWILEWPARAVIGCVWPGLPNLYSREPCVDNVH